MSTARLKTWNWNIRFLQKNYKYHTMSTNTPLGAKFWLNADEPNDSYKLRCIVPIQKKAKGTMRMWLDGCFDMMHFGHANVIRQAAILGEKLQEQNQNRGGPVEVLVGCHSDEEIVRVKGPPIMHEEERYEALRACKWTTFTIEDAPYNTRLKDMERLEVDFVVHGDDISVDKDGKNSYQEIIDAGKMKVVKRTESISTTELVGRMLLCTMNHQLRSLEDVESPASFRKTNFLTTSRKIIQFSNNTTPSPGSRVVYVDGGFDLFHVGHIDVLRQARELGDYVIVGLYEDSTVNEMRGNNYPIMNMNERMLGILACRYVDEVVLGVPPVVTDELLNNLGVDVVVKGSLSVDSAEQLDYYYAVPIARDMLVEVDSKSFLTTDSVIQRVLDNRVGYLKRQAEKSKKDKDSEKQKPDMYKNVREI